MPWDPDNADMESKINEKKKELDAEQEYLAHVMGFAQGRAIQLGDHPSLQRAYLRLADAATDLRARIVTNRSFLLSSKMKT